MGKLGIVPIGDGKEDIHMTTLRTSPNLQSQLNQVLCVRLGVHAEYFSRPIFHHQLN